MFGNNCCIYDFVTVLGVNEIIARASQYPVSRRARYKRFLTGSAFFLSPEIVRDIRDPFCAFTSAKQHSLSGCRLPFLELSHNGVESFLGFEEIFLDDQKHV